MRGNGETDFTPQRDVSGNGIRRQQEGKHCTEVYQGHGNILFRKAESLRPDERHRDEANAVQAFKNRSRTYK
jgi:hypothetical protein